MAHSSIALFCRLVQQRVLSADGSKVRSMPSLSSCLRARSGFCGQESELVTVERGIVRSFASHGPSACIDQAAQKTMWSRTGQIVLSDDSSWVSAINLYACWCPYPGVVRAERPLQTLIRYLVRRGPGANLALIVPPVTGERRPFAHRVHGCDVESSPV